MKEREEEQQYKTECICIMLIQQCHLEKAWNEDKKKTLSKVSVPDAEILFLLLLVFLERPKIPGQLPVELVGVRSRIPEADL